jgi:hypothetical protein
MNPFLIVGGIAALFLWSKNSKAKASAGTTPTGPAPSPANPSGLDRPLEPTGPPVVVENPVEPTGPSDVPEIRETTAEIVVVDDGNWSEGSTSNVDSQLGLQDNQSAIPSPTNYRAVNSSGWVHQGQGVYSRPQGTSDCPEGYFYSESRVMTRGYNGCITEDRYVQIVKEKMPQINPMPASVWQDVILLNYAGNFYDRSVLTMPASELVKEIRDRVVGCSNQWCKVVQNTFLTDTTAFANDRFTFKDVVWATMDNNYIAFYPIPVKAGGSKRKAAPVYAMFPVTQAEYNDYKEYNRISKL